MWTAQQKQVSFVQLAVFRAQLPPMAPNHRICRPLRMAMCLCQLESVSQCTALFAARSGVSGNTPSEPLAFQKAISQVACTLHFLLLVHVALFSLNLHPKTEKRALYWPPEV